MLIAPSGFLFSNQSRMVFPNFISFPYKKQGLTEREAAAHLLNRFTHGIRPGQIDQVVEMGLENWFLGQLEGKNKDEKLNKMLESYPDLQLSNAAIVKQYPKIAKVIKMAVADGVLTEEEIKETDRKKIREKLTVYYGDKKLKPTQMLVRDFVSQKILRATYSENQLHEVLTGFWFNHFNVSFSKNQVLQYIPVYERDAIRPNVLGSFENLLLATAKSPAMLLYLDNFSSTVSKDSVKYEIQRERKKEFMIERRSKKVPQSTEMVQQMKRRKSAGLNENYAREVMELHTLGVDGGYSQQDVTEAARVLTGWTFIPADEDGIAAQVNEQSRKLGTERFKKMGFVRDGDFIFAPNRHDAGEKKIMGVTYEAGKGYEEGLRFFHDISTRKETAKFISTKLANYFVSDQPSESLVLNMSDVFMKSGGDIKKILIAMVESPEFWKKEVIRSKIKSPFDVVIGSIRALDASVIKPYSVFKQIDKMGQKIYHYSAPTGFPDRDAYWINTGALLNRMNFALELAAGRSKGLQVDLLALNQNHEPGDATEALHIFAPKLIPERDLTATYKRIDPWLNNQSFSQKIALANQPNKQETSEANQMEKRSLDELLSDTFDDDTTTESSSSSSLAQVVGIILGSPEFQRK
jgi:uncharacterized protein (DUF1800 family)